MPRSSAQRERDRTRYWRRKANGQFNIEAERARSKRNYRKAFAADPERVRARSRSFRARRLELIRAAKDQPCADCGVQYPHYVMDFDHVYGQKIGSISQPEMLYSPIGVLMAEMNKCDVVCSNCHRERTYQRLSSKGDE